ncbi:hypothetical protein CI102_3716 [Trichoderma harzianum]|nr:hypothetical protein CI102_3716 [Trichoderma harzianum]
MWLWGLVEASGNSYTLHIRLGFGQRRNILMLYEISLAFFLGGIMNLLGVGSINQLRVS